MDRELIERLVVESGLPIEPWDIGDSISTKPAVMRFAALVAEECANVVKATAEQTHLTKAEESLILRAIREKFSV